MVKRALIVLAIATSHFIDTIVLFGILYSRGMAAFDRGSGDASVFDSIVGHTLRILWFPYHPLAWWLNIPSGSIFEWALLLATSILWACMIYLLFRFVSNSRKRRMVHSTSTI